eukprot:1131370-Amphidinium_carterae.1
MVIDADVLNVNTGFAPMVPRNWFYKLVIVWAWSRRSLIRSGAGNSGRGQLLRCLPEPETARRTGGMRA